MENRRPGKPKGLPKSGGRKKGTPNKSTAAFKQTLESLDFDVAREAVKLYSELPTADLKLKLLQFIAEYSVTRPKDTLEIPEEEETEDVTESPEDLLAFVSGNKT